MLRTSLLLAALLVMTVVGSAAAEDAQTLNGQFVWSDRGKSGDLKAVFTPTGESTWNVDFRFSFRDQDHTYSGTAEGSLTDGRLSGTVQNEDKKRTFTFAGSFENGTFNGKHSEITGGDENATGTLTLRN